jgi:hypothetical protein
MDDDTSLTERAESIDREFEKAGLYFGILGSQLRSFVEELKEQAETEDPDYFDVPLAKIYDWCDVQYVWCGG